MKYPESGQSRQDNQTCQADRKNNLAEKMEGTAIGFTYDAFIVRGVHSYDSDGTGNEKQCTPRPGSKNT
ncbi:hypothetical protein [Rothia mucilaginosa]|uniref:hypothetical protein n=1 Tax=Rothia mucilaginosa TaxID=43675 RepID=UPI0011AE8365|nr:hypothetical protein [Rothia mucilaginosa]